MDEVGEEEADLGEVSIFALHEKPKGTWRLYKGQEGHFGRFGLAYRLRFLAFAGDRGWKQLAIQTLPCQRIK